jgi:hypothetical protein
LFQILRTDRYYRAVQLTTLDWVIVIISIVLSFVPAIYLMRRAGSSTTEFFTSGRAAPWWLIGGSMVATTFSTDTPKPRHESRARATASPTTGCGGRSCSPA